MSKLTSHQLNEKLHQREDEGNSAGTYFAIAAMVVLLAMVSIYFWIDNGHQFLESPVVQQGKHLTPHDGSF